MFRRHAERDQQLLGICGSCSFLSAATCLKFETCTCTRTHAHAHRQIDGDTYLQSGEFDDAEDDERVAEDDGQNDGELRAGEVERIRLELHVPDGGRGRARREGPTRRKRPGKEGGLGGGHGGPG